MNGCVCNKALEIWCSDGNTEQDFVDGFLAAIEGALEAAQCSDDDVSSDDEIIVHSPKGNGTAAGHTEHHQPETPTCTTTLSKCPLNSQTPNPQ